jgi:hypothetical protein
MVLRACEWLKQRPEFKMPSSTNPFVGDKGADKVAILTMI